ncbi:hypothetical protein [Streptomyces sp. NPDC007083]|uniref:hypothetical protein n=1 Tax=Streptomyces sp. NPDC007083 TaxID=3156913 RepID=UPI0033F025CF
MSDNSPATPTVKHDVTVVFGAIELTGSLYHDDEQRHLELMTDEGPEPLSVSLEAYGFTPPPGHVFIKDWSEHAGLTANLERAGFVKPVLKFALGPFNSPAFEVAVTL